MTDQTEPARYRRATEAQAVQWTGNNETEMAALCSPFDFQTIDPEDRVEDPDETAAFRTHGHGGWVGLKPGDWVVKEAGRFTKSSDAEFRAEWAPAGRAPDTDQATLRDRIAAAIWERQNPGRRWADCEYRWRADAEADADAVLSVLPASIDRAAVLEEAADRLAARAEAFTHALEQAGWMGAVEELRAFVAGATSAAGLHRAADETETEAHACPNCDGIDPDSCLMNADRAAEAPATECSAQHRRFDDGRLCIRAAQHHGDHIDERGFHWSDTVAVYPLADSTFRTGVNPRAGLRRAADETPAAQAEPATDLPARLEATLTQRYTELQNPFSEMRRQEKGPDGWPASHPVGPHHVAEVLRELIAEQPAAAQQPKEADRG
jgi:hypothetical protein